MTTDPTAQAPQSPDEHSAQWRPSLEGTAETAKRPETQESTAERLSEIAEQIEGLKVDDDTKLSPGAGAGDAQKNGSLSGEEDEHHSPVIEDEVDGSPGVPPARAEAVGGTGLHPPAAMPETRPEWEGDVAAELPIATAEEEVRILDPEEGSSYLAHVMLEVFNR